MLQFQSPPRGPEPGPERKVDKHKLGTAVSPAPSESFPCARMRTSSEVAKLAPPPRLKQARPRRGGIRDAGPETRRRCARVSVAGRDSSPSFAPSPVLQ